MGWDGMGDARTDQTTWMDFHIGYGILEWFSICAGTRLAGNGYLANGASTLRIGGLSTPVNTDHFDLDVYISSNLLSGTPATLSWTPGVEFNFDLLPDHRRAGVYTRFELPITGTQTVSVHENTSYGTDSALDAVLGTYLTLREIHQLLLEYGSSFAWHKPNRGMDSGAISMSYNVMVSDNVELLTGIEWAIPTSDNRLSVAAYFGFIMAVSSAPTKIHN